MLRKYHPVLAKCNPTIGRLGKARRRKQARRHVSVKVSDNMNTGTENSTMPSLKRNNIDCHDNIVLQTENLTVNEPDLSSKRKRFIEFCHAAFERLGLECVAEEELQTVWDEIEPKTKFLY